MKLAGTAYRRDDFTLEAFFEYWRNVHAPISGSVPGLGGYVVSEVRSPFSGALRPDALLELWWPDEATFEASGDAPAGGSFGGRSPLTRTDRDVLVVRESVLVPPPATGPGSLDTADA